MAAKLYTLDILNQAQGPFAKGEVESLSDEHAEVLVYDAGVGEWRPISAFAPPRPNRDPDRPLAGRASDAREGELAPRRQIARAVEEILGVCRGLVADGVLNEREAGFLEGWCKANPNVREHWPVSELVGRIRAAFSDGVLSERERQGIEQAIHRIVGALPRPEDAIRSASRLPVDLPEPEVAFAGKRFVVTGEFIYGDEKRVHRAITERGGRIDAEPGLETDFVVVGTIGAPEWERAPWGSVVGRAARVRAQGGTLAIVAEDHWARHLRRR